MVRKNPRVGKNGKKLSFNKYSRRGTAAPAPGHGPCIVKGFGAGVGAGPDKGRRIALERLRNRVGFRTGRSRIPEASQGGGAGPRVGASPGQCPVLFACYGECPRNRFITAPGGEAGLNYLCAGLKAFFTHIDKPMKTMASLLKQGRYADEIMQMPDIT